MADTVSNHPSAREQVTKLYDEKLVVPLSATLAAKDAVLPMLAALSDIDKQALNNAANAIIEQRSGQEAFVPSNPTESVASLARSAGTLEGFLKVVKGENPGPLSPMEKNAATHRWEMFDQFAETSRVLAQAAKQALPLNAALTEATATMAAQAGKVEESLAGRENDSLFMHAVYEMKTGKASHMGHRHATSESTAPEIIERQLAHPLHAIANASEKLQAELANLSDADKQTLTTATAAYAKQFTLPDTTIAQDIPAALPELIQKEQALRSLLTKVASGQKTAELTPQENAVADAGIGATTNDLHKNMRALAAVANASNTTEAGAGFASDNGQEKGKFDKIIRLAGKIASKSWHMQVAIDDPAVKQKLETAIAEYRAKPIDAPSTQMTDVTATPVQQQTQSRGAA